ncbi:MAG TPA: arsenate reductase ArsC [Pyrinomonadaceae bacterium]|nr:arsenate reductase ArsC [Pyrinomonadaceae bacterium]
MADRKRVLILCTGNSARSQMAEGLLREMAGDRYAVASAGVAPTRVRQEAIAAMKEIGIDINEHRAKSIEEFTNDRFDYVITVCDNANQQCPTFPGAFHVHWSIEDPAAVAGDDDTRLKAFRIARDDLLRRLREFTKSQRGQAD